jgi:hypothetical protein
MTTKVEASIMGTTKSGASFTLTVRPGGSVYDGVPGFVAGVVGGPQDLLWRAMEEFALSDGLAYVRAHWDLVNGAWVAL